MSTALPENAGQDMTLTSRPCSISSIDIANGFVHHCQKHVIITFYLNSLLIQTVKRNTMSVSSTTERVPMALRTVPSTHTEPAL